MKINFINSMINYQQTNFKNINFKGIEQSTSFRPKTLEQKQALEAAIVNKICADLDYLSQTIYDFSKDRISSKIGAYNYSQKRIENIQKSISELINACKTQIYS